ncbi:hypothetical protein GCM10020258_12540 [Sphingomonas yabuuchiae]
MDEQLRLQPAMVSRRLLVLTFIRAYVDRWGGSPSIGEIAQGIGASRTRVQAALRSLEQDKQIIRRPGARGSCCPTDWKKPCGTCAQRDSSSTTISCVDHFRSCRSPRSWITTLGDTGVNFA